MFLSMSLFFCVFSFFNMDPMKSSFFLIFSLLGVVPLISLENYIWYSYFICLLFLSGIFVIIVYFSSLSKFNFMKSKLVVFSLLLTMFLFSFNLKEKNLNLSLSNFYYDLYFFILIFIIFVLLFFMSFSSYFLNFSGALRKF